MSSKLLLAPLIDHGSIPSLCKCSIWTVLGWTLATAACRYNQTRCPLATQDAQRGVVYLLTVLPLEAANEAETLGTVHICMHPVCVKGADNK